MLKKIINHSFMGEKLADHVASYIRFTKKHNKFTFEPTDIDDYFRKHDPFILSVWHGQFLLIPTIRPKDMSATIVVGRHGDAELAAKVVKRFGVTPVRGSGAGGRRAHRDRGGAKALREAITALKKGDCIVSTADVPPGPAQKVGQGIITMARLSGRPIIPAAIATKRAITFQSWSRLTINLPFSKGALVASDPIYVPRKATPHELEQIRQTLESAMGLVTSRAHALAGRNPKKIAPLWERPLTQGIGLKAYKLATQLARPLAPLIFKHRLKRGKEIKEREPERYGIANIERPPGPLCWFHAASVGETNSILPLIQKLLDRDETLSILLTTGTLTSASLAQKRLPQRAFHQFIPLDNANFVRKFLTHWQPNLAVFVESEIWPNLILETKNNNIPLIAINARMSKRSFKKWFKKPQMARPLFGRFDAVLAQSPVDANHFIALGAQNVISSGNLKIDTPPLNYDQDQLNKLKTAIGNRPVLVAASTHKGEDEIIAQSHKLITLDHPDLLTIIVPRHPERANDIQTIANDQSLTTQLRTEHNIPGRTTNIYIANTMGELGLFYALTKTAFIGGSLVPRGGQNPIEAIKQGVNVLAGPYVDNFGTFYFELFSRGGAYKVLNAQELATKTIDLFNNESQHDDMKKGANAALDYLQGAMDITLKTIETYLKNKQT